MEARSPFIQDYLARLTERDWEDLYKRIRLFAYMNYGWMQSKIGGLDLEEVILESIEDAYFGARQWPVSSKHGQDRQVSLCAFLCQTVRSKVSHILEREKRKVYLDGEPEDTSLLYQSLSLRSQILDTDEKIIYNELCRKLLSSVRQDILLTKIARLYIDEPDIKPRDMAERLSLSMATFRNAQKRLNRKVRRLKEEWRNG